MIVEIRSGEGGDDAKGLISKLFAIYIRRLAKRVFSVDVLEERPGFVAFRPSPGSEPLFVEEAGGHRWQHVPPNEKRGRVQTPTVTVAVLSEPAETQVHITETDLEWSHLPRQRSRRPEEKHDRKRGPPAPQAFWAPCQVRWRTIPAPERASALALLRARLWAAEQERIDGVRSSSRKDQIGSGMRGDKRRTVREQDGQVKDHVTGKTWRWKDYERGEW